MNTDPFPPAEDASSKASLDGSLRGAACVLSEPQDDQRQDDQPEGAQSQATHWHHLLLWGLGLALLAYMVVLPIVSLLLDCQTSQPLVRELEEMTLAESIRIRAMQALTGLWFITLGGTIGSFLNVVAYRMPRGESVIFRPSRCPKCESRILGQDNIPIVGWLRLKGRCRVCHAPISSRYPIVESIAAGIFFLFFLVQLITGGANIPLRTPPAYAGIVWIIFYTKWEHVALYLYHCLLASTLLTWALIDIDRQRITQLAKWVTGLMLVLPAVLWPKLLPVPWWQWPTRSASLDWTQAAATCLLGGSSGLVLGYMIAKLLPSRRLTSNDQPNESTANVHLASGMGCVGMVVGWQATFAIALIMLVFRLLAGVVARWSGRVIAPPTTWLLVAFVGHHLICKWTTESLTWWPGPTAHGIVWIVAAASLVLLVLINHLVVTDQPSRVEVSDGPMMNVE